MRSEHGGRGGGGVSTIVTILTLTFPAVRSGKLGLWGVLLKSTCTAMLESHSYSRMVFGVVSIYPRKRSGKLSDVCERQAKVGDTGRRFYLAGSMFPIGNTAANRRLCVRCEFA